LPSQPNPFHDPALGQYLEALSLSIPLNDLELPSASLLAPVREILAAIGTVSPDLLQARY
jgi:hypothetical protein